MQKPPPSEVREGDWNASYDLLRPIVRITRKPEGPLPVDFQTIINCLQRGHPFSLAPLSMGEAAISTIIEQ